MSSQFELKSPNSNLVLNIGIEEHKFGEKCAFYELSYKNSIMIEKSRLGLLINKQQDLFKNIIDIKQKTRNNDKTWKPLYGEKSEYPDHYNEITLQFLKEVKDKPIICIIFRLYNEGFAFKYTISIPNGLKNSHYLIKKELTEFKFPPNCLAYEEHGTEGKYFKVPINKIRRFCERPLTVEYSNRNYISLTEAETYDYPRMLLKKGKQTNTLTPDLIKQKTSGTIIGVMKHIPIYQKKIQIQLPFASPWRVFIIGENPGQLNERNYLILNLNLENQIKNADWIKPGKVLREISLSTPGGIACIDFAAHHNIEYVEYDAGWYGPEGSMKSDATTITLDHDRVKHDPNHPGLDLQKVIEYGNSKGVGIIVYVNYRGLVQQLDEILPLYKKWGIKGIKFGFVAVGPQYVNKWLLDAVKKCAEYNLLVDIHDNYRPTGFSRTYPNLMTQEGIRGNEHMPTATHNCTLPFTRFPMGAGDYTICYYSDRIKNTHAHQLAMSIIVYSPLQFIYWYDNPEIITGQKEIHFFEQLHTVWDDKIVLFGEIGEYFGIARRKSNRWFVGIITNEKTRKLTVNFDFLTPAISYHAEIYEDQPNSNKKNKSEIQLNTKTIGSSDVNEVTLNPSGGLAIILTPQ